MGDQWPVLLGGAALTRAYVEEDLAELYEGEVRYARDAFEGLRLMDAVMARQARRTRASSCRRCGSGGSRPVPAAGDDPPEDDAGALRRRDRQPGPDPAVLGRPGRQGHPARRLRVDDSTSGRIFLGQWGLKPGRGQDGPSYDELVETEGRPRLREWLDRIQTEGMLEAGRRLRLLPVREQGRRPRRPRRRRSGARAGSPSRGSGATGTCASRTSSGPKESRRDRRRRRSTS